MRAGFFRCFILLTHTPGDGQVRHEARDLGVARPSKDPTHPAAVVVRHSIPCKELPHVTGTLQCQAETQTYQGFSGTHGAFHEVPSSLPTPDGAC
jgi:hypothetical protein